MSCSTDYLISLRAIHAEFIKQANPPLFWEYLFLCPHCSTNTGFLQSSATMAKTSQRPGKAFWKLAGCFLSLTSPCITSKKKNREDPDVEQSVEHCRKCPVLSSAMPPSDVKASQPRRGSGEQKEPPGPPDIPQNSSVSGRLVITASDRWMLKNVHKKQARTLQVQMPS